MPKKTKREKILAEYRKKLKQLQSNQNKFTSSVGTNINNIEKTPLPQLVKPAVVLPNKVVVYQESEYDKLLTKFTIQDLTKTFFITLLILALEFFVFYVNLKK
jgi:hypothetical protein